MLIFNSISALREQLKIWRSAGDVIAMVPTMGHLHQGHISLIEMARERGDRVVASIYVNPMQFDRADDLDAYPRTLENDIQQLEDNAVDLLFTPDDSVIYPDGHSGKTRIDVPGMTDILCGAYRPGHFVGVATIVCKLFNMVTPDVAIFGEKDFQQLMVIRQMTSDLNLPVEVVGAPTWREPSGLAMSSRNSYLSDKQRGSAALLYQVLCDCAEQLIAGERAFSEIEAAGIEKLDSSGFKTDFVSVRRRIDLGIPDGSEAIEAMVVLAAAFLGKARLIDNLQINHYLRDGKFANAAVNNETGSANAKG